MESNKILIGIEFYYNRSTVGGFELMVLRDLTLNQLLEGIKAGLNKKTESKDAAESALFGKFNSIFLKYCEDYDSIIITSSNKGIDSGISIRENGDEKLFSLGFITSTRILFCSDGEAVVFSLNNPDDINPAFIDIFPEYNISTRQLSVIDTEPIKIIMAPDPPEKPKLNILAMILPSMAMTLAMVLGRSLFMGGSGGSDTLGMIGLGLSMVAVNVFVSLYNYNRQLKEHKEKVNEWKEQYENYISKTILRIEDRQIADMIKLNTEYPGVETLFDETMKVSENIYSRAQNDKDFMVLRLGSSYDVDTLFEIKGDKGDVIFSPTKYVWNPDDSGIKIILLPEKVKSKNEKDQKDIYEKTEDYLIDLPYDIANKYKKMKCGDVPLLLSLRDCGALGIVSPEPRLINRLVNNLIYELCFYHSPEDLQFIMFYAFDKDEDVLSPDNVNFQKFKFSSHFKELFNNKSQFVFDERNAKLMFDSLLNLLYERRVALENSKENDFCQIVVVIYEEYRIKEHAIANFLPKAPKEGEAYENFLGITFIFCKHYKEHLPSYCGNVINIINKDQMYLTPRHDDEQRKTFLNPITVLSEDPITKAAKGPEILRKCDFYNRLKVLSAIHYTRIAQNANVPSYITIFELLGINKDTFKQWLEDNWTKAGRKNIAQTLSVPVGKSENSIVSLDLHEKYDGPHMLVAGTTGSGKSETIISYLVGLCLYYTPEEMNMLLIDMKGGGFIKRMGNLPHVVGTVTDVDGDENGTGAEYMLKRFLDSLASEVKRRKILFNQMAVDSIDGYIKKHRKMRKMSEKEQSAELIKLKLNKMPASLSHLVFVVDEFTELKRASAEDGDMDFIAEITTIARVGRSLGFHIILISQNIEGAITDDIRVNSKARLCLKVATKQASKEMIGNDKAAAPDMPGFGRAYLLVGTGSRFEYFQSAYSGAKSSQSLDMPFEIIKAEKEGNYTSFYDSARDSGKQDESAETQLEFLVANIIEYYEANSILFGKPHIIFNQPLPNTIIYDGNIIPDKLPAGIYDDPKNQKQALFTLNLQKSNIIVFGSAMSGKTTCIKNLIIKMHELYTAEEENVYIIDFSGALLNYKDLGFVCACFDNSNEENIRRLFNKLENILHSNSKILGGVNFPEYKKENKPPHTTFIIENFSGFLMDRRYETYQEILLKLCREGLSKGITIILTASDLAGGVSRYASGFGQKISFEMPADKLSEIFNAKVNPPMNLQGRGLANIENQVYEFHGFLPFNDENEEFEIFKEKINDNHSGITIPRLVSFDGELTEENFKNYAAGNLSIGEVNTALSYACPVTVGLDYYNMKPVSVDLYKTSSIGIYGKRQSGKSNLLWLLVESALNLRNELGLRFVLFEDGRKELEEIAIFLNEMKIEFDLITKVADMEDYLFKNRYYKTQYDDFELKDNPFTVFIIQNKSAFTGKADELMRKTFPEMLSEAENKWMFIYSDVKNITEMDIRNHFNDSLSVAFLLDNIGEFVSDRGAKTIFGAMDAKELKETYARIEKGDGYFYDIESDELMKLKFIYSDRFKKIENAEV